MRVSGHCRTSDTGELHDLVHPALFEPEIHHYEDLSDGELPIMQVGSLIIACYASTAMFGTFPALFMLREALTATKRTG